MRVVIIADFAEPSGGGQAVAIQSAVALAGRGVPVTYIHGLPETPDPRLAASGVDTVGLGLRDIWALGAARGAAAGIWRRQAAKRLAAAIAALPAGPTVLHLHQWTRSLSPAALPVILGSPHPVVLTLHDYSAACPNGVYFRFDQGEPCRLRPLSGGCLAAPCDPQSSAHKAVRVLRTVAMRHAIGRGGFAVIHVSDRGRETVSPFLPAGLRHYRLDNPVEAVRGRPTQPLPGARIAFIGRLTREKGADLVAAASRAAGIGAVFIGEGPAEAEIRRLAPAAEITGWRSRGEIQRLLVEGVLAVAAPSRWYETGPLTVYEALAAGVPAVVSARAGASEKVVHGETGLVVQPTVPALTDAFASLTIGNAAGRMGRLAYDRYWEAPLDAVAHVEGLVAIYAELLAGRV